MITNKGRALALELAKHIGVPDGPTQHTLSLIARHAQTHTRLAETACNRELTKREQEHDRVIEARIRALVATLPPTKDGPITVRFDGDPRGYTVKLHVPNAQHDGNTWGRDGDYGV